MITLVQLPRLDGMQQKSAWFAALDRAGVSIRVHPVERAALPAWIVERMAAQGQGVASGPEGQKALAFFADRIEGNLLAAHQEVQKLGLLYPPGELSFEQIEAAVLNVARYDVFKLGEAVLAGQARAPCDAEGLQARARRRCGALDPGENRGLSGQEASRRQAMPWRAEARSGARGRVWRALPLSAPRGPHDGGAHICDGLARDQASRWPLDTWQALGAGAVRAQEPRASAASRRPLARTPGIQPPRRVRQSARSRTTEPCDRARSGGLEQGRGRGPPRRGHADPDRSHRLGDRSSARPGNAGDRHRDRRARMRQRPFGHGPRDPGADGAMGRDQLGRDAEHPGLGVVGVGDEAALEPVARSRQRSAGRGDQAAGARFRGRQAGAAQAQRRGEALDQRRKLGGVAQTNLQSAITSSVHSAATNRRTGCRSPGPRIGVRGAL